MSIKKTIMITLFSTAAMISLSAQAYSGSQYASEAKITIKEAREIALKVNPGTVVDEELEHKSGGLRFSIAIRAHHVTNEIAVDANTGKVLSKGKDDDD